MPGLSSCLLYFCCSVCGVRKDVFTSSAHSFLAILGLGKSKNFPKGNSDKEPAALLCVMRRCQKERSAHTVGAEGLSYRLATALARWSRLVWERRGGENGRKVPPLPLTELMAVFQRETSLGMHLKHCPHEPQSKGWEVGQALGITA